MYEETASPFVIKRTVDGAFIPRDPGNRDYAAFLQWQADGGVIVPYIPPTPGDIVLQQRGNALAILDSLEGMSKAQRSLLLAVIDELNELRQRFNDLQADVASSNNLLQVKPKWALRLSMPARNGTELKTIMTTKITSGAAD